MGSDCISSWSLLIFLLRKLLKTMWQNKILDTEVPKRAGMQLKLAQLRWTSHVTRMPDERLPNKVLYGELQVGKRARAGQNKRYKYTLEVSLKDIKYHQSPGNRVHRIVQSGVVSSEKEQMTTKQTNGIDVKSIHSASKDVFYRLACVGGKPR